MVENFPSEDSFEFISFLSHIIVHSVDPFVAFKCTSFGQTKHRSISLVCVILCRRPHENEEGCPIKQQHKQQTSSVNTTKPHLLKTKNDPKYKCIDSQNVFPLYFQVCFAYDTGFIPPNLNYESPREGVSALSEGRMTVVCEKEPWNRGMVGVNSFGFGGANAHVLLKNFAKPKVSGFCPLQIVRILSVEYLI